MADTVATAPVYPPTPALDKMKEARPLTEAAADFYDYLAEQGIHLVRINEDGAYLTAPSKDRLLADWQGLDLDACEAERIAVLNYVRACQGNAAGV